MIEEIEHGGGWCIGKEKYLGPYTRFEDAARLSAHPMPPRGSSASHGNEEVLETISSLWIDFMDTLGSLRMDMMTQFNNLGQLVGMTKDYMRTIYFRDQGGLQENMMEMICLRYDYWPLIFLSLCWLFLSFYLVFILLLWVCKIITRMCFVIYFYFGMY